MKFNIINWFKKNKTSSNNFKQYDAAHFGRLVADWVAGNTSADSEIKTSLKVLRNRSRALGRNNDYMRNFYNLCQINIAGPQGVSMSPQPRVKGNLLKLDEKTKNEIEWLWEHWRKARRCHTAGRLHFIDIERLICREVPESGEFFIRFVNKKFSDSKVPLALELIEADQVDENINEIASNGNKIIMGVEKDKWGAHVAYYVKKQHPGDNYYESVGSINDTTRIPATEMIQVGDLERWPQTRCIPWAVSAMIRLHNMGGYEQAELVGARAAAALMGFIETPEESLPSDATNSQGEQLYDFEPGVFKRLGRGEKMTFSNFSRPSGQLDPFMSFMLRGVAAGTGTSYPSVSKDYSKDNYSSARQGKNVEEDLWRTKQLWLIRTFHEVVYERFLEACILSNLIKAPDYWLNPEYYNQAKWMPRGWEGIDPEKEVNAKVKSISSGIKTLTAVLAADGKDLEEELIQRKNENELLKKYGIVLSTDPLLNKYTGTSSKPNSESGE